MENILQYPCGLKVVIQNIPYMRSVSAGIWVRAGSIDEDEENNGISHFTEHMMFKGTSKLSAFEIAKKFEDKGASVNAFTGKEYTCYFFKSVDSQTEECFSILSDLFFDSSFKQEELDRERKVITEEINMVEDTPEDLCYDLAAQAMYDGHSLAQTILGSKENVAHFQKHDIEKYMEARYIPQNIVIAFAGNINTEQAADLVEKYFLKNIKKGNKSINPTKAEYICGKKIRIDDFEQSNLIIAYPSLPVDDDCITVQNYLNVMLGASMSSRLFQEVREKLGLAYSVYTSPSTYMLNGTFNICLNISPENTTKAYDATFRVIDEIKTGNIEKQEFIRAREQLKASLVFAQENVQSIMLVIGKTLLMTGKCFDVDEKIRLIDEVTEDDIKMFINNLFSRPYATAYVGKKCDFVK